MFPGPQLLATQKAIFFFQTTGHNGDEDPYDFIPFRLVEYGGGICSPNTIHRFAGPEAR